MKFLAGILLLSLVGCMESTFGYKDNPIAVVLRAYNAVQADDQETFARAFGRGALCNWGNEVGFAILKDALPSKAKKIQPELVLTEARHLDKARFMGYWAYYFQSYHLQILHGDSHTLLAEAKVECHFGVNGVRRDSDLNRPISEYPEKHCKVVVFEARNFKTPAPKPDCEVFTEKI